MLKKVLIGSIVFFILALGIAGYFLFFNNSPTNSSLKVTTATNSLPLSGSLNIHQGQKAGSTRIIVDGNGNKQVVLNPLMELSSDPVAGGVLFERGTSTIARYAEKGTGHISEVNVNTGTTSLISNTTIQSVYEAQWLPNGNTVILRYPNSSNTSITSYSVAISRVKDSPNYQTVGTYLPNSIDSLAVSPDGTKIVYAAETNPGEKIIESNPDGTKAVDLYTSLFGEWLPSWPVSTMIALTTKPSFTTQGYLYSLSPKNSILNKLIEPTYGLTDLVNSTGKLFAYSDASNQLYVTSGGNNTPKNLIQTLADKCVWSKKQPTIIYCAVPQNFPSTGYPDGWYQGIVSFSDSLYKIDTTTGTKTLIANLPNSYHVNIDVINPSLSPDEHYMLFTNKIDYTLWSFNIASSTSN